MGYNSASACGSFRGGAVSEALLAHDGRWPWGFGLLQPKGCYPFLSPRQPRKETLLAYEGKDYCIER